MPEKVKERKDDLMDEMTVIKKNDRSNEENLSTLDKLRKQKKTKVVSVKESEKLQSEGYSVLAMYKQNGQKVHELFKEE